MGFPAHAAELASAPPKTVSFADCKQELLDPAGAAAQETYTRWTRRPAGAPVVAFVQDFTHRYLYQLTSQEVRAVMQASNHALGTVRTEEQLPFIEDFTCPFALQHIFHRYLEDRQEVPTWAAFWRYLFHDVPDMWLNPLHIALMNHPDAKAFKRQHANASDAIRRAVQWRLGKFYLSAMRELDLLVRLQEAGVPIKYHLLADVLLRVDFWVERTLVCLYFSNNAYRNGEQGRKIPAQRIFRDARPAFQIEHLHIERQGFGRFWLATDASLQGLIETLR